MFEKKVKEEKSMTWTCSHLINARTLTGVCQAVRMFSSCIFQVPIVLQWVLGSNYTMSWPDQQLYALDPELHFWPWLWWPLTKVSLYMHIKQNFEYEKQHCIYTLVIRWNVKCYKIEIIHSQLKSPFLYQAIFGRYQVTNN